MRRCLAHDQDGDMLFGVKGVWVEQTPQPPLSRNQLQQQSQRIADDGKKRG